MAKPKPQRRENVTARVPVEDKRRYASVLALQGRTIQDDITDHIRTVIEKADKKRAAAGVGP